MTADQGHTMLEQRFFKRIGIAGLHMQKLDDVKIGMLEADNVLEGKKMFQRKCIPQHRIGVGWGGVGGN